MSALQSQRITTDPKINISQEDSFGSPIPCSSPSHREESVVSLVIAACCHGNESKDSVTFPVTMQLSGMLCGQKPHPSYVSLRRLGGRGALQRSALSKSYVIQAWRESLSVRKWRKAKGEKSIVGLHHFPIKSGGSCPPNAGTLQYSSFRLW